MESLLAVLLVLMPRKARPLIAQRQSVVRRQM